MSLLQECTRSTFCNASYFDSNTVNMACCSLLAPFNPSMIVVSVLYFWVQGLGSSIHVGLQSRASPGCCNSPLSSGDLDAQQIFPRKRPPNTKKLIHVVRKTDRVPSKQDTPDLLQFAHKRLSNTCLFFPSRQTKTFQVCFNEQANKPNLGVSILGFPYFAISYEPRIVLLRISPWQPIYLFSKLGGYRPLLLLSNSTNNQ